MKHKALILMLLVWLSVGVLAQGKALDIDSVGIAFRGVRLFPSEIPTSSEIAYATDSRIFKVLKSNDTIVAVTDNKEIFENPLIKLTRAQIKRTYIGSRIKFVDDDAPCWAVITGGRDTIFYIRNLPMPNCLYEFESGVIENFELIKMNRSTADLVELLRLGQFVDSSVNTVILVHPQGDRYLWTDHYRIASDSCVLADAVAITRHEDEIQRIVVTSVGCFPKIPN